VTVERDSDTGWRAADAPGATRRYLVAGVCYVVLGLLVKQVMAWWSYGLVFLLLALWGVPTWRDRWRDRRRERRR
jgi:hypothetical protein